MKNEQLNGSGSINLEKEALELEVHLLGLTLDTARLATLAHEARQDRISEGAFQGMAEQQGLRVVSRGTNEASGVVKFVGWLLTRHNQS